MNTAENFFLGVILVCVLGWVYWVTLMPYLMPFVDYLIGMVIGYFGMKAPAVYDTFGWLNHTRPQDLRGG